MDITKSKYRKVNIVLSVFAGLLTLILVPTLISYIFNGSGIFSSIKRYLHHVGYGFSIGLVFWLGNWAIGSYTGRKLNWAQRLNSSNLIALLSFIFYGIFISVLFPYFTHKYIFHSTGQNLKYNVIYNAFLALSIDLIIISIYYSRYLVHYWQKDQQKYEETKRAHLIAKYEALKNQVNPHFLFNSLNTLTGIVEQDQGKAVHFIKKLSDIYRYVLEQRDKELVSLQKEVDFVENYVYLAKMRHGDGLKVTIDIKSNQKFILPLGLQILVENCIKHNIISDNMPLNVTITEEASWVVVKNNLQKKKIIRENTPVGLDNLNKRYAYITDIPVEVINDDKYFTVKVPLIESSNELLDN